MTRNEIADLVKTKRQQLASLNVESLHLFGSLARNEARLESDADFVVRFKAISNFDQFMDLKMLLEEVLGTRVDLVTDGAIRPDLRAKIERDAIRVA